MPLCNTMEWKGGVWGGHAPFAGSEFRDYRLHVQLTSVVDTTPISPLQTDGELAFPFDSWFAG